MILYTLATVCTVCSFVRLQDEKESQFQQLTYVVSVLVILEKDRLITLATLLIMMYYSFAGWVMPTY